MRVVDKSLGFLLLLSIGDWQGKCSATLPFPYFFKIFELIIIQNYYIKIQFTQGGWNLNISQVNF